MYFIFFIFFSLFNRFKLSHDKCLGFNAPESVEVCADGAFLCKAITNLLQKKWISWIKEVL